MCLPECVVYVLFVTYFTDYGMDEMIYGMVIVEWLYLSMIGVCGLSGLFLSFVYRISILQIVIV